MKVGIIGARIRDSANDYNAVLEAFFTLCPCPDDVHIVSGGCPQGGDRFAEQIAKAHGIPITIYHPNWRLNRQRAGFMRNTTIARESDYLIACVSQLGHGGTEDTIKKFLRAHGEDALILVEEGA